MERTNLYEEVTQKIVDLLTNQQLNWDRPWISLGEDGLPARNASTNTAYSGVNQFILSMICMLGGYPKNAWLTFRQIQQLDGRVKKGSKSSRIYFQKVRYRDKSGIDYEYEAIKGMNRQEYEARGMRAFSFLRFYSVFNVFQTTGLPNKYYEFEQKNLPKPFERDDRAEKLLDNTDAKVIYGQNEQPGYVPSEDVIYLPLREQFKEQAYFYETALHELAHWTGHESRLNRPILNKFGTAAYAQEELIAELTSAFLCSRMGFTKLITNNAAYIQSWLKALKDDSKLIFHAARQAEKAAAYITHFKYVSETV